MTQQKPKKYLWILSTLLPLLGLAGIGLYEVTSVSFLLVTPLLFIYIVVPALDHVFSQDDTNPNESDVPKLENTAYYNWILYLMIPVHFFVFTFIVAYMVSEPLMWWM